MADPNLLEKKDDSAGSGQSHLLAQLFLVFCLLVCGLAAYGNYVGWYPTYGIFSGENSYHSSNHYFYHGGYGIHGK